MGCTNQVSVFRKGLQSQIYLPVSWTTVSSRALPWQIVSEGKDFRQGAQTTLYLHTQSNGGFSSYFRGMFLEGKSFTACHLPSVNKFWKNIWLDHVERTAGQINRNNFTFFPLNGVFMLLPFSVNWHFPFFCKSWACTADWMALELFSSYQCPMTLVTVIWGC